MKSIRGISHNIICNFFQQALLQGLLTIADPTEEERAQISYHEMVLGKRERKTKRRIQRRDKKVRRRARGDDNVNPTDPEEEFEELVRQTDDSSSDATTDTEAGTATSGRQRDMKDFEDDEDNSSHKTVQVTFGQGGNAASPSEIRA